MNREQAKIRCRLSKEEWGELGELGYFKWYKVMEHFANGFAIEYETMGSWRATEDPDFDSKTNFRTELKPCVINGFEVPAPIKKYTGQKTVYFPSFSAQAWCAQAISKYRIGKLIARRIAFETPEAARANSMAMLGIDPSTYKEQSE